jgi:signal transduction histidine kinase
MFKRLQEKNRALILTNEELDKFVYSASHDLRSPIISLRGLVEIAQDEKNPVQLQSYFKMMDQSLSQQDIFLRELIDFSRNKRATVTTKDVDLVKLVDDVVEQHSFIDEAKDIDIHKEIRSKKLIMDELRLKIILNNLLSNAIKYSDPKKELRKIFIRSHQNNGTLILQVQDNGLGIKKEDHGRIFEMFFVTGDQSKGSGLGLYITLETVQKLNGKIELDSEPGVGTTFTISVPLKNAVS